MGSSIYWHSSQGKLYSRRKAQKSRKGGSNKGMNFEENLGMNFEANLGTNFQTNLGTIFEGVVLLKSVVYTTSSRNIFQGKPYSI